MKPLSLAVVSDIHVGKGARSKDLCPAGKNDGMGDAEYTEKFTSYLIEQKITADFLIIPGDITHAGQPDEMALVASVVDRIAFALKVPTEKIVFVPGNHDVDWEVLKVPDPTGIRRGQRYDPIRNTKDINRYIKSGVGDVLTNPHFTIWDFPALTILGYNSAHDDGPTSRHNGLITEDNIAEIKKVLSRYPFESDKVRLFVVHHHPLQYNDPTPEDPDQSIMVNAEALHRLLIDERFDILIHGHKHLPKFTTYSLDGCSENCHPLLWQFFRSDRYTVGRSY